MVDSKYGGIMTNKRKSHFSLVIISIIFVVALIVGAFSLGHRYLIKPYNISETTSEKFAKASKWLPQNSDFFLAIDTKRALAIPGFKEGLTRIIGKDEDLLNDFISMLITKEDAIGMIILTGNFSKDDTEPLIALIAQGNFDEKVMIPAIRAILAAGKSGLVSEPFGGRTLYFESDSRNPFAFVVLNKNHIAIGTRSSITKYFSDESKAITEFKPDPASYVFGTLLISEKMRTNIPKIFAGIEYVNIKNTADNQIAATIPISTPEGSNDLRMFLEGIKSIFLLNEDTGEALKGVLNEITIKAGVDGVTVAVPIVLGSQK